MNSIRKKLETIKKWSEYCLTKPKIETIFEEFRDSEGNVLTSVNDILFTDEGHIDDKRMKNSWGLEGIDDEEQEEAGFVCAKGPDVIPVFEHGECFPISVKKEGQSYYIKTSRMTNEILPIHAGSAEVLSVIFIGSPSAGKTVYFLQLVDEAFHDMLAKSTTCSFADDMPMESSVRKRYEEVKQNFKNQHILPPPNRRGEIIEPYFFYVQCEQEGRTRRALLRLEDIDGEQCTEMEWESKIFRSNIFVLMIGADELLAAERGEAVQYTEVGKRFLSRVKAIRQDKEYEVRVMITKADLLDFNNPYLRNASENSVEVMENGKVVQTAHGNGFDYDIFSKRSKCVQDYLKNECPNFYRNLMNTIPPEQLDFCMVASIGEECNGNRFENYKPMFIDEPILSILTKENLYPVKAPKERPEERTIKPVLGRLDRFYKAKEKFINVMRVPDGNEDEQSEEKEWEEV